MNYSFACVFMETDQQKISKLRMDFVAQWMPIHDDSALGMENRKRLEN